MSVLRPAAAALLALLLAGDGTLVLDDFEAPVLAKEWTAWRASVRRVPSGTGGALEVSGWKPEPDKDPCVEIRFPARDLRGFDALAFKAARSGGPVEMFVTLRGGEGYRMVTRRVRLDSTSGETVLPLRRFEEGRYGLLGSLASVDRLQFRWENPSGTVVLDDLRLVPGKRGEGSCRMTPEDWLAAGLPGGKGRALPGKALVLLTDRKEYQGPRGARVLASLEEVLPVLAERFALKPAAGEKSPFFLVGEGPALSNLFQELARFYGFEREPLPPASSYCMFEAAGAALNAEGQYFEPAAQHQAVHLVVARSLRFSTGSDWIQEALASSVGRRLAPSYFDTPGIPWRRVSAESFRLALAGSSSNLLPLSKLLTPEGDKPENYIEFASLGDYLSSRHRAKLPAAWDALRAMEEPPYEAGMKVLCGALGMTPAEFEADWMKWGAANFR